MTSFIFNKEQFHSLRTEHLRKINVLTVLNTTVSDKEKKYKYFFLFCLNKHTLWVLFRTSTGKQF